MTAPHIVASISGHSKVAYFTTAISADQGPGPYTTSTLSLSISEPTEPGVVLVIGFWTAVNASGVLPTVSSIGGDATFSRYIDTRQDGLVPAFYAGSTTPGQMGTELWWAYSNDALDPSTTFTLTFDPPLSYASNRGVMICGGYVIAGCATPSSPWDPRIDLPHVTSLAPSTGPDVTSWMLSTGSTVTFSDGLYNAHLIWGASALVGTDGDELGLMLDCIGGTDDILSGSTPYGAGWTGSAGGGVSGNFGVPNIDTSLTYKAIQAPFATSPTVVLFPPTDA